MFANIATDTQFDVKISGFCSSCAASLISTLSQCVPSLSGFLMDFSDRKISV